MNLKSPNECIEEIDMDKLKPIFTFALALIPAAILSACADFKPCGSQSCTADATITSDLQARLDQLPDLGPPGSIRVQTLDRVVYLNGAVDVGLEKREAESLAREAPGVMQVVNSIAVAHD
jgi:osmotically-inducible protein OsmY